MRRRPGVCLFTVVQPPNSCHKNKWGSFRCRLLWHWIVGICSCLLELLALSEALECWLPYFGLLACSSVPADVKRALLLRLRKKSRSAVLTYARQGHLDARNAPLLEKKKLQLETKGFTGNMYSNRPHRTQFATAARVYALVRTNRVSRWG